MKKKHLIIAFAGFVTLVFACTKFHDLKNDDPTREPSYLYGRLFLNDTQTQSAVNVPLGNKTVTVRYSDSPDTLNYLYSTTTDADGYFKFSSLNSKRTYTVAYQELAGGKLYTARSMQPISLPADTCRLFAGIAMKGQTGIIVTVTDSQGKNINGADVCFSLSSVGYNSNVCDGSNYSFKSDANGHATQFNMSAGSYYVLSKIAINGTTYIDKGVVNITAGIVATKTFTLNVPTAVATNGLNVVLVDAAGKPVNNGRICLFTSKILFARDTCEGSNYSFMTNPAGKGSITSVVAGKYYVLGEVALTGFKLLAKDSVTISDKMITDTLRLKR